MAEIWRKACQKQPLFTSFRNFTVIFRFYFLTDSGASKSVLGSFSHSLRKSDPKTCIAALYPEIFWSDFFYLLTWDDLDLYYGHKTQELLLPNVSDTIHADSLALFGLHSEIVLADVTKPEKSNILALTWPVTSSVTSRSSFTPGLESSCTGLANGVWILEIGPVVWEIIGGPILEMPFSGKWQTETKPIPIKWQP